MTYDYQKELVEEMRDAGCLVRTCEFETGHCLMFTMCDEVGKINHELAIGH